MARTSGSVAPRRCTVIVKPFSTPCPAKATTVWSEVKLVRIPSKPVWPPTLDDMAGSPPCETTKSNTLGGLERNADLRRGRDRETGAWRR
jgi:hypothetical protein